MAVQTLVVEDDNMSLKVMHQLVEQHQELNMMGSAQTANEALSIAQDSEIDLLLLDIGIPEVNGLELIKQFPGEPVVILTTGYKEYALEAFEYGVTDYLVKPINKERFNQAIKKALEQIHLYKASELRAQESSILRMLRFLYSRNVMNLVPEPDRHSQIGYSYPFLSLQYDHAETYKLLDILEEAEQEEVLVGSFQETIHLCYNCNEGFLQYREVCPKCESPNLLSEDLIHHFPCAYIGPTSDFTNDPNVNMLTCPKCDQHLRHIGVDYDKPSLIYTCQHCFNRFQDVFAYAKCLTCESDMAVEHLRKRIIRKYEVTAKGLEATRNPQMLLDKQDSVKEATQIVDYETFDLMLNYEIKRRNASPFEANIGVLHIEPDSTENENLGNDILQDFQNRALIEFKEISYQEDVIMYWDSRTFLFSLLGPKLHQAKQAVRQLAQSLTSQMKAKFHDQPTVIKSSAVAIKGSEDAATIKDKAFNQVNGG